MLKRLDRAVFLLTLRKDRIGGEAQRGTLSENLKAGYSWQILKENEICYSWQILAGFTGFSEAWQGKGEERASYALGLVPFTFTLQRGDKDLTTFTYRSTLHVL